MNTDRLVALDETLAAALPTLVDDRKHGEIAALRSAVRRIVALARAKDPYALLMKQAV
jgi:hypothetical protein